MSSAEGLVAFVVRWWTLNPLHGGAATRIEIGRSVLRMPLNTWAQGEAIDGVKVRAPAFAPPDNRPRLNRRSHQPEAHLFD